MQDRPTSDELIDAVREFLESEVVPAFEGRRKFHARVAANVLAVVGRELRHGEEQMEAEWRRLDVLLGGAPMPAGSAALAEGLRSRTGELCERIRSGAADRGPFRTAVVSHVRETVREKLVVANPKRLG